MVFTQLRTNETDRHIFTSLFRDKLSLQEEEEEEEEEGYEDKKKKSQVPKKNSKFNS